MFERRREPGTSEADTPSRQCKAGRLQPRWPQTPSKFGAVVCIAAVVLMTTGLNGKASAQAADQPLPIWSVFDDLLAKCFEFFNPPSPPAGPPPPGPEPIPIYPIITIPGPDPIIPPPVVNVPRPDTPPWSPPPAGPVPIPGPVAGAGLPTLMLMCAVAWFRRRKAHKVTEAGPTGTRY
jgi:hypothetical protein